MAGYEQKPTGKATDLPKDLPEPKKEQEKGVPEGAIFVSDDGKRYRLKHEKVVKAHWEVILPRPARSNGATTPATETAAPPAAEAPPQS